MKSNIIKVSNRYHNLITNDNLEQYTNFFYQILKPYLSGKNKIIKNLPNKNKLQFERKVYDFFLKNRLKADYLQKKDNDTQKNLPYLVMSASLYFEFCYKNNLNAESFTKMNLMIISNLIGYYKINTSKPHLYFNIYVILYFFNNRYIDDEFKRFLLNYFIKDRKLLNLNHFLLFLNYSSKEIEKDKNKFKLFNPFNPYNPKVLLDNYIADKNISKDLDIKLLDVFSQLNYLPLNIKKSIFEEFIPYICDNIDSILNYTLSELFNIKKNLILYEFYNPDINNIINLINQRIRKKLLFTSKTYDDSRLNYYVKNLSKYKNFIDKDLLNDFLIKIIPGKNESEQKFYNILEEFIDAFPMFISKFLLEYYRNIIYLDRLNQNNVINIIKLYCFLYGKIDDKSLYSIKTFTLKTLTNLIESKYVISVYNLIEMTYYYLYLLITERIDYKKEYYERLLYLISEYYKGIGLFQNENEIFENDNLESLINNKRYADYILFIYTYYITFSKNKIEFYEYIVLKIKKNSNNFKINKFTKEVFKLSKGKQIDDNYYINNIIHIENSIKLDNKLIVFNTINESQLEYYIRETILIHFLKQINLNLVKIDIKSWVNINYTDKEKKLNNIN